MAQGIVTQDRRQARASGIVERHELLLADDGSWQVRDTQGSGRWYRVVDSHCSCADYVYRQVTCKHLRAVMAEEQALAGFARQWDHDAEQQRQSSAAHRLTCSTCGGHAEALTSYCGGHGYVAWALCTVDSSHPARRLS